MNRIGLRIFTLSVLLTGGCTTKRLVNVPSRQLVASFQTLQEEHQQEVTQKIEQGFKLIDAAKPLLENIEFSPELTVPAELIPLYLFLPEAIYGPEYRGWNVMTLEITPGKSCSVYLVKKPSVMDTVLTTLVLTKKPLVVEPDFLILRFPITEEKTTRVSIKTNNGLSPNTEEELQSFVIEALEALPENTETR